ncbi:3'-5' exonuclease [Nitratifractor salsuginis]|uniref:Exonuclease RNase T and DNA polymerase III n=1 Tax=Nitratifractor salsuginis (strain DSM 16511 / JCM 12458 / E9I37-1) TaxID=749222 RepID=E6X2P7_NITSE|nr:3'-5' exonuclease [Nitratifractor salsuginis]ADV46113.1 Exonuclease RNase T and DNA polymerase III [Nitratifractor salsuginis DSM 16511]
MKTIILDTETTGTDAEDRICQLAYLVLDESGEVVEHYNELCTPPLEIKYDAMAIHHITPEMLEGKPACTETEGFRRLRELNSPENLLVIQNAPFDLAMLEKEGFENRMRLIDTFRLVRKFMPDSPQHGQQYLRYALGLYREEPALIEKLGEEVRAHDALGDVIVLKHLYEYLLREHSAEEMAELCEGPILLEQMPMGRHRGKRIEEVALQHRNDLLYMVENFDLDQDVRYSFEYWLEQTKDRVKVTIGFGKHKGKTPEEVVGIDRSYLEWMRDKADRIPAELKAELERVLGSER